MIAELKTDRNYQARLLAVSGVITCCPFHIAVCLSPGLRASMCGPRQAIDPEGTHGLPCWRSDGRKTPPQGSVYDLAWRAHGATSQMAGWSGEDWSKTYRTDGLTQMPWRTGKCMTWDVTVWVIIYLPHHHPLHGAAACRQSGTPERTLSPQSPDTCTFIPLAIETFGPLSSKSIDLLADNGEIRRTFSFNAFC